MCDTIIADKTDFRINNIPEIPYLILSYLYIGGANYRIYSGKIEPSTNITFHKIT